MIMTGPDAFYTPDCYAVQLLSHVVGTPRTAVDFCVGDGGLLKAAEHRFAGIDCFGVDISDEVLTALQMRQPTWHLAQCDFTDAEALARIPFLQGATFDLIVLNPPFTCRGSSIKRVMIGEEEYHMSTAMSFLVGALPYLSDTGAIYAILPISCVYSQKDRQCWQYLQENYHACVSGSRRPMALGWTFRYAASIVGGWGCINQQNRNVDRIACHSSTPPICAKASWLAWGACQRVSRRR